MQPVVVPLLWCRMVRRDEEARMVDTAEREAELAEAFADIARQLQAQNSREETWQKIIDLSHDFLPEFEHAAISLVHGNGRVDTVAATDDVPRVVDRIQYETGEGPCLSAIREENLYVTGDLGNEDRWPKFTARTVDETGIRSMLSFQLFVDDEVLGALNLYNHRVDAFDERAQAFGGVLAAHAAIAMSAANAQDEAEQLETALASSREIGTALGILMVQGKVTRDRAFQILSTGSQRTNVKLRELAARIVAAENERNRPPRPQ